MGFFTQRDGRGSYKPYILFCPECGEENQISAEKVTRITKKRRGEKEVKIKARCPDCGEFVKNDKDLERVKASKNAKPHPATKKVGEDKNGDPVKVVEDLPEVPPSDLSEALFKEKFLRKAREENPEMNEQELEELYEQSWEEKTLDA